MTKRKKKKTKTKAGKTSFSFSWPAAGKSKRKSPRPELSSLAGVLKFFAVIAVVAGIGIGFVYLKRFVKVKKEVPAEDRTAYLELINVPQWVTEELKAKLVAAATAGGEGLKLDEDVAVSVWQNIETQMSWLEEVRVQIKHDRICIEGFWRRPVAVIEAGRDKFYVDSTMAVMDFVAVPELAIVEIKGARDVRRMPAAGSVWQSEDAAAAVAILVVLAKMDASVTPEKPLLGEIDSIDVSNFNGRKSSGKPHIVLYAKDGTEIIWGAEFGTWQRYMEAPDDEKIAKLYGHYKEYGSLLNGVKFINLREPRNRIPQPIDKY